MTLTKYSRSSSNSDRGAALVEFSIVAMLLLTLGCGVFEAGMGWSDRQLVTHAARSGARAASQLGTNGEADAFTVRGVEGALGDLRNSVARIVVYKPSTNDGSMPPACETAGPPGVADQCSVYGVSDFGTYDVWSDGRWPPSSRKHNLENADYVGVRVEVERPMITRLFAGSSLKIADSVVMRIEPEAGS